MKTFYKKTFAVFGSSMDLLSFLISAAKIGYYRIELATNKETIISYKVLWLGYCDRLHIKLNSDDKQILIFLESNFSLFASLRLRKYFKQLENQYELRYEIHNHREKSKNAIDMTPPWKAYPGFPPYDPIWRNGADYYLWLDWEPFWMNKTDQEKKEYLDKHNAPEEWRQYLEIADELDELDNH